MKKLSFEKKIQICKDNDEYFNGQFYLAVKSTKIFCLPTCKAKFPLVKNVSFYDSIEQAINEGFRPCKRCHPERYPYNYPLWVDDVKYYIDRNFSQKINENDLVKVANVDITTIRRYFKKFLDTSPKAYQIYKRMELALQLLNDGEEAIEISSLTGYKSFKSFKKTFMNHFGFYPRNQNDFNRSGLSESFIVKGSTE